MGVRTFASPIVFLLITCGALSSDGAPPRSTSGESAVAQAPIADPTYQLILDGSVRRELDLTPAQQQSLDALLRKNSRLLLSVRDVTPGGAAAQLKDPLDGLRGQMLSTMNADQQARFEQLVLQAQGFDALRRDDIARAIGLSPEQRQRLLAFATELRAEARRIQQMPESPDRKAERLAAAQEKHRQQILSELTSEQQQAIGVRLGEKFDLSNVRTGPSWAPEFESVSAWVNSSPLTLEELRGKVVVVHFFAFGCINCIHNYPWYKKWQSELSTDDVVMIGIHTPETAVEADIEQLKRSLDEHGLTFPVAVDNNKKNWQNWSNDVWPAVYLIDREGRLRYWWYGELDWQEAGGQLVMRERIGQLIAEKPSAK